MEVFTYEDGIFTWVLCPIVRTCSCGRTSDYTVSEMIKRATPRKLQNAKVRVSERAKQLQEQRATIAHLGHGYL